MKERASLPLDPLEGLAWGDRWMTWVLRGLREVKREEQRSRPSVRTPPSHAHQFGGVGCGAPGLPCFLRGWRRRASRFSDSKPYPRSCWGRLYLTTLIHGAGAGTQGSLESFWAHRGALFPPGECWKIRRVRGWGRWLERIWQGEALCCAEREGCEYVLGEKTGQTGWGRTEKGEGGSGECI